MTLASIYVLVALQVSLDIVAIVHSHPQCLDYYPPFHTDDELKICTKHSSYGCCNVKEASELYYDYQHAIKETQDLISRDCLYSFRDLLCAQCHPYASHIFDAESPASSNVRFSKRSVGFPGLCREFCLEMFDRCRLLWRNVANIEVFQSFMMNANSTNFCDWAQISDPDYCLPLVGTKTKENDRFLSSSDTLTTLCVQELPGVYSNPLLAVSPLDGTHRLFVGEQRGMVHVRFADGQQATEPFLDIRDRVLNSGAAWDERGFLGMAFHPKFASNGRFFVYYSARLHPNESWGESGWSASHKIRVSEFTLDSKDPNKADASSELVLLEVEQPEANHEGGMLLFGDDGYLYIFVGDGGGAGDQHGVHGNAQNMTTLLGKVLRIDVNVEKTAYRIPKDNPYSTAQSVRKEIYASGIRNIWRCSKDRGNKLSSHGKGRIFCGDVGQNKHEEINIIHKGANYGWRAFEGYECFDKHLCRLPRLQNSTRPILAYSHHVGKSVVGGYVYRGCAFPNMLGHYIYGDTITGRLFIAKEGGDGVWLQQEVVLGNASLCNNGLTSTFATNILSFGEQEDGEIVILSTFWPGPNSNGGRIYRIVDPTRRTDPNKCKFSARVPASPPKIKRRKILRNASRKSEKRKIAKARSGSSE